MEDNGCPVLEASGAPFFMSQLLFKLDLDPNDNSHFGREMKTEGKEERVSNLTAWSHQEANIRFRGKSTTGYQEGSESRRYTSPKKSENNATNS